jgi:hypothetical protein
MFFCVTSLAAPLKGVCLLPLTNSGERYSCLVRAHELEPLLHFNVGCSFAAREK